MATARLVASSYSTNSNISVSSIDNAYKNTDTSSNYATFQTTSNSTSDRLCYLKGFNFSSIPSDARITAFSIKIRGYESGINTSTSYAPCLVNNTTVLSNTTASSNFGQSVKTIEIPTGSLTWSDITGYGANFGIRFNARRNSRNTASYIYISGAEIEVTYSTTPARTVTTTLTGDGTIEPSGTESYYDEDTYNLTVIPTDTTATVSATKNGNSISLTQHTGGAEEESKVLGTYTLVSGSFNGSGATYFSGLVGKGYDATQTTSNYYSGSSGTIAVFTYAVPFTDIPVNATITNLYMKVNGHAESTSNSNEYMCAQLKSGNTELSSELNFKSIGTSNSTQTVTATTLPTVAQLANLVVQCRLGYYGGAINGATVYLEYETSGVWYTYSTTISGDMTVAVTIGTPGPTTSKIYLKENGSWVQYSKVYKKINGSWVEQSNPGSILDTTANYVKKDS